MYGLNALNDTTDPRKTPTYPRHSTDSIRTLSVQQHFDTESTFSQTHSIGLGEEYASALIYKGTAESYQHRPICIQVGYQSDWAGMRLDIVVFVVLSISFFAETTGQNPPACAAVKR